MLARGAAEREVNGLRGVLKFALITSIRPDLSQGRCQDLRYSQPENRLEAQMDDHRISLLMAERDVARHELSPLSRLINEIRIRIESPGNSDEKIGWLIDRLSRADAHA